MREHKLYVLSGPSGCGKTTLINSILNNNSLNVVPVRKYGTRRRRGINDDVYQVFSTPIPHTIYLKEIEKIKSNLNVTKIEKYNQNLDKLNVFFDYDKKFKKYTIKNNLTTQDKEKISNLLEDLKLRLPIISTKNHTYWGADGEKIKFSNHSSIDIAYALNKGQYGISTANILSTLESGQSAIIILSDFRIIRKLKNIFKEKIVVIYIASAVDTEKLEKIQEERYGRYNIQNIDIKAKNEFKNSIKRLNACANLNKWDRVVEEITHLSIHWSKIKDDNTGTKLRTERIKAFHTRYIDNLTIFDHIILNYREGKIEDMTQQFINIYANPKIKQEKDKSSPLIVVAAASNAGKGTMMEMLNLIGSNNIQILSKIAQRQPKLNDKNDGMLAIGTPENLPSEFPEWPKWWTSEMKEIAKTGYFPKEYDFRWSFHGGKVFYAISNKEIQHNFKNNKIQIVISNIKQFAEFKKRYGSNVVFVLLYRVQSMEDTKEYLMQEIKLSKEEALYRAKEVNDVLVDYIENISYFDHVILNTSYPEDMFDQVFQLVEYYQ